MPGREGSTRVSVMRPLARTRAVLAACWRMRMEDDDLRASSNVEDRRGMGMSVGRGGGLGIGAIAILGLIGWALGINPAVLIGGAEMVAGGGQQTQQQT